MVAMWSRSSIHPFILVNSKPDWGSSAVCGVHERVTKVITDDQVTEHARGK